MGTVEKQPQESGSKTIETLPDGTTIEKKIVHVKNLNGTEVALEITLKARGNEWLEETIKDAASGGFLSYNNFEKLREISNREDFLEDVFGTEIEYASGFEKRSAGFLPKKFIKRTIDKIRGN